MVQIAAPTHAEEPATDDELATPCVPEPRAWLGRPLAEVPISPDDPAAGRFTLAEAVAGLRGTGGLVARIATDVGELRCELWPERAPITVANFVGLARGRRPWKRDGVWVTEPAYENGTFHRIVQGFMVQGGDPTGTGQGGPGYVIPDEIWEGAAHDRRGLLCMANRGPNTNGMQFFITDAAAPHLDASFTIFGECGPEETIERIAATPVDGPRARPARDVAMSVSITRDPSVPGPCD